MQCPSKTLFCGGGRRLSTIRIVVVENKNVKHILLGTGCTQTMVRQDVQEGRLLEEEAVAFQCTHGDTVLYPLEKLAMEFDGV